MSNHWKGILLSASWLALFAGGCVLPDALSPKANHASRCQQGIDMFERSRCGGIKPTAADRTTVDAEYQDFQIECTDEASKKRLAELESCVAGYHETVKKKKGKHDDIREKYEDETVAVKADPAYSTTLEAWALARDEAQIAEEDWETKGKGAGNSPYRRVYEQKKKKLEELEDKMRKLLKKHGVDPKYAGVLGLW